VKPAAFEYVLPGTVAETVSILEKNDGDAKILAGGQSLIPLLNMRLARPTLVVDLGGMGELDYIREKDGALAIGAMTTKRTVEDSTVVRDRQPLLHEATRWIAHPAIRNRGTLGGSLAHADPAAEYPAVAVALDAELTVAGPGGERTLPASEFFVTYLTTALEPAEVLTEIRFPAPTNGAGWSFQEVARRHGDFAIAGLTALLKLDDSERCSDARIVLFGVGPTPTRAREAEQILIGQRPTEALFEEAARNVYERIDEPISDVHASAEYRRDLARVLTRRALREAAARCGRAQNGS
jgi:CO/xanthine dehydrogenase FAD-binding subunit